MTRELWAILLTGGAVLLGLGGPAGAEPLATAVSIAPVASVVECVGGEHVVVQTLVAGGQDPHTYSATPRAVVELGRARLYFTVGLPFETRLVDRIQAGATGLTVVDAARGVPRRVAPACSDDHAGHEPGDSDGDLHVWLSPEALRTMAANVAEALQAADPQHGGEYRKNLQGFLRELDAVDVRVAKRLAPWRGRTICVYHPALGYYCDRYGLVQQPVETGGKAPTPRQLRELIAQVKAQNVKVIFVQKQFDQRAAETVAQAIGGRVVTLDPLAKDVLGNLEAIAESIDRAMREP